jgi:DNA-binding transcriptional LysR family regulator
VDLVRHLRFFVVLSETRHYGKAASRLGITQPPLSQGIQRLEQHLGARLFDRNARGVRITDAGSMLLPKARAVLAACEELRAEAGVAARPRRLTMGVAPDLGPVGLAAIRAAAGTSPVEPSVVPSVLAVERVATGQLDLAVVHHPGVVDGTVAGPVVRIAPRLLLERDHPLARARRAVALRDLDLPLATLPRWHQPAAHDQLVDTVQRVGHSGLTVQVESLAEAHALVVSGSAVCLKLGDEPEPACASRAVRDDAIAVRLRLVVPPVEFRRSAAPYDELVDTVTAALGG